MVRQPPARLHAFCALHRQTLLRTALQRAQNLV